MPTERQIWPRNWQGLEPNENIEPLVKKEDFQDNDSRALNLARALLSMGPGWLHRSRAHEVDPGDTEVIFLAAMDMLLFPTKAQVSSETAQLGHQGAQFN